MAEEKNFTSQTFWLAPRIDSMDVNPTSMIINHSNKNG